MKSKKSRMITWTVVVVAIIVYIFANSLQPAVDSSERSSTLLMLVHKILPGATWITEHIIRKVAHFTEYAVLGFFMFKCVKEYVVFGVQNKGIVSVAEKAHIPFGFIYLESAFFSLLTALSDETIQLYVEGRSGQITDIWLDFAGALTGALILFIICKAIRSCGSSSI